MTDINALLAEIARWEQELAMLEDEATAEGWTTPEKLLFTMQRTVDTYRRRVLPRVTTDGLTMRPASTADQAPAALTAYSAIVADELTQLVDTLEELRIELIRFGQTAELQLQAAETLAALRALVRVLVRIGQEVQIPGLATHLAPEQSAQLTTAVHAYEKDLR
ncbi:hypothetical protein GCM10009789_82070 [Kribbella sancticallisti]|uniref:Uncharacterized protein n=1 Tax=Kribbella sancticallisti TaxID=460087 RepID=A0ABP4QRS3_9ACTN